MEFILLAGGKGKRLRSLISDVPKPMAKIEGKPFIDILLSHIVSQSLKPNKFLISVGYKKEIIINYLGNKFRNIPIEYIEEDSPLGTGGATLRCLDFLKGKCGIILNADTFLDIDYSILKNNITQRINTVVTVDLEDTSRYGLISTDANNKVLSLKEKSPSKKGFINSGCYLLFKKDFLHYDRNKNSSLETDILPEIINNRNLNALKVYKKFIDIGIPTDFLRSSEYLKNII